MSKLLITLPDINKPQDEQNKSSYNCLSDISNWASTVTTSKLADLTKTVIASLTATTYSTIPQMSVNFSSNSNAATIIYNLSLTGEGFIGLSVNGTVVKQKHFNYNATLNNLSVITVEGLRTGNNNVSLVWKAVSGTITIQDENTLQILSANT